MLRLLKEKDVDGMLEWMCDDSINCFFQFDSSMLTEQSAREFVKCSIELAREKKSFHYAIVDENDEYLGTISIKNINWQSKAGEYAIGLRKKAAGKGIAYKATCEILEYAFVNLGLNRVFLNVLADNSKAIRLYEKSGFIFEGIFKEHICIRGERKSLKWYAIMKKEWLEMYDGKDNA